MIQTVHLSRRVLWLSLFALAPVLAGCAAPLTYAEVQATARVTGCWPDPLPTPRAVTVTPANPQADQTPLLPTTTPYPRCPPAPGATQVPWPTPAPNPPLYPTMAPRHWQGGGDQQTTLFLPSNVLTIDLATHPIESWAAVGAVVWSGNRDPERAFVSVYHPQSRVWSPARQVDIGPSQLGRYSRTVAVAISGDRAVHAVWGMSDPDFRDNDPPSGIWASSSTDFGTSWSPPQRIASDCRRVNDLAATLDGALVAQLICNDGPRRNVPAMVVRRSDGVWLPPERLPFPVWYFSEGSLVIIGEGDDARAVGILFAGQGGQPMAYLISRRLADTGPWQIAARPVVASGGELGQRMWHVRGLVFERPSGDPQAVPGIIFTWTDAEAGGAYALTSLDGGRSWGPVERIAAPQRAGEQLVFAAPAYDPAADRLVAVWTCCAFALFSTAETTHYAGWSVPGSGVWQPGADAARVPLVFGARSAFATVIAQARNSRSAWIAWIERQQRVELRSFELNQIVPVDQYQLPGGQP